MSQPNYNRGNSNRPKSWLEQIANDLPKGYLKAGLDFYNGLGKEEKALALGAVAIGLVAYFGNRSKR